MGVTSVDALTQEKAPDDLFDREAVMKFINDTGLLSYNVRALRINDYLKSLYRMAHLLTMSGLHRTAIREVQAEIAEMIHDYMQELKAQDKYDSLVLQVKQFKLATQIFDAFGETVDSYSVHDLFTTTDTDIDRQFRIADVRLGNEGIGMVYGNKYMDVNDPNGFKVDVILFVVDDECMNKLHNYAENRFHSMNDDYRRYIATIDSEKIRRQYDSIVSDGDVVSKHNFRLPETIQIPHESGGTEYRDHLFVSEITGVAKLKLNEWEAGVIAEEQRRDDFVCWIRNPSRGAWALCIPYEIDGETKPTYPDFIIVRIDKVLGYVIDILEPHNPEFKDNLGKAKGFAEYARQNPGVGRIQLIRMGKDSAGNKRFKRLDMSKSAVRDKVSHAMSNDELDHIFDTDEQYFPDGYFVTKRGERVDTVKCNTAHVVNLTDLGKQLIAWHSQRPTISYSETKIFDKYFDQLFHRDYAPENVQALNVMFAAVYEKWGKENPMGLNETLLAMKAYAPYHQLFAISAILCEINKMNDSVPSPSVALRKMTESGLLDYIVEMAGNCLNMAMETAQDTVAADTGKLFVPQNWIKSKASLKDIRAAVKQMVASLKMLPDGKKVLARLNEGLAMNKEDFEARWTAD